MPTLDLTPYYQPQGSTSDGTKFDNGLAAIQSTINALDNNNVAAAANIAASKIAGLATVITTVNLGSASTDLATPGAARSVFWIASTGGGTLRSIGAPTENGSRIILRNGSGSSITLKHQLAGGVGSQLYMRTLADVTLLDKEIVEFSYDGTNWYEVNRDQAVAGGATTYRRTTATTVSNTVTETDLLGGAITIAANPGTSAVIRLTAWGDSLYNVGAVALPRYKLKLGATVLLDTGAQANTFAVSASRFGWRIIAEIMNLGAANSQWATFEGKFAYSAATANNATTFTTGEGSYAVIDAAALALGGNSGAVDTTVAQALVLSVILPTASASMDTVLKGALVEIV